jgi:hypothetical protein
MVCLRIGRPSKMPPDDVESKRVKDQGEEGYVTVSPRAKVKKQKIY